MSYDLETVVGVVSGIDGVSLDIAGSGPYRERICTKASSAANIRFHGYLDKQRLSDLLRRCDVGLVPMFPDSCVGVPGKLADYAAVRLMVIESLGGETARIVDRFNAGCHYKAGDAASLRDAIEDIRRGGNRFRSEEFAANFDSREVMSQYVRWIEGLMRCRKDWGTTRGPHPDPLMNGRGV